MESSSDTVFSPLHVTPFYRSPTPKLYMNGRATQASPIATQLPPHSLNVLEEPDTEALQSGKPEVYTLASSVSRLNSILTQVKATGTNISDGRRRWRLVVKRPDREAREQLCDAYPAVPGLDTINIHRLTYIESAS